MQGVLEVRSSQLESLYNAGLALPYAEFDSSEPAIKLIYDGEEYWYYRTLPLRGYGAALARHVRPLLGDGRKVLLARFRSGPSFSTSHHWERLFIYATGVRPIGAGKPPAQ